MATISTRRNRFKISEHKFYIDSELSQDFIEHALLKKLATSMAALSTDATTDTGTGASMTR